MANEPTLPKPIKRGGTIVFACLYKPYNPATEAYEAASLVGIEIQSQLRKRDDTLIDDFIATAAVDQVTNMGEFILEPTATDTNNWPLGDHIMDIAYMEDGELIYTETYIVPIEKQVTRWRS